MVDMSKKNHSFSWLLIIQDIRDAWKDVEGICDLCSWKLLGHACQNIESKIGIDFSILSCSWKYESKILTVPQVVIEDNHRQSI